MSRRSDAVQSLTLIFGSAFAAVFVTSVAMMATERPMETEQSVAMPSAPVEATTTVEVAPRAFTRYVIGRVEPGKSGTLPIRYRFTTVETPIVFMNGAPMKGSISEALGVIDPADVVFVETRPDGANPRTIRLRATSTGKQDGNDG